MICPHCGQVNPENAAHCAYCGAAMTQQPQVQSPAEQAVSKPENVIGGIIGALIGSAIGVALIVILGRLGVIASIAGVVMAFCSLKGYEKLGGKLSTKGIIICVVLMLIMTYVADRIDWALVLMDQTGAFTFGEAYALIPELLEYGDIESETYISNLLTLYGFTALGAVGTIFSEVKKKKEQEKAAL